MRGGGVARLCRRSRGVVIAVVGPRAPRPLTLAPASVALPSRSHPMLPRRRGLGAGPRPAGTAGGVRPIRPPRAAGRRAGAGRRRDGVPPRGEGRSARASLARVRSRTPRARKRLDLPVRRDLYLRGESREAPRRPPARRQGRQRPCVPASYRRVDRASTRPARARRQRRRSRRTVDSPHVCDDRGVQSHSDLVPCGCHREVTLPRAPWRYERPIRALAGLSHPDLLAGDRGELGRSPVNLRVGPRPFAQDVRRDPLSPRRLEDGEFRGEAFGTQLPV